MINEFNSRNAIVTVERSIFFDNNLYYKKLLKDNPLL